MILTHEVWTKMDLSIEQQGEQRGYLERFIIEDLYDVAMDVVAVPIDDDNIYRRIKALKV